MIFSGPMVRAILEGRKTQTRRVVKSPGLPRSSDNQWRDHIRRKSRCPYGVPGDRLWVRESHGQDVRGEVIYRADDQTERAREQGCEQGWVSQPLWRSPIHMPRWASRLTLEVVSVRVERLQEISERDARAEGIERSVSGYWHNYAPDGPTHLYARDSFRTLWDSLNAARGDSWAANPWVWALEFRRVTP
jgi:hypothetical protein